MCVLSLEYRTTVKPVNKGRPGERQQIVFIDKWSLFGGFFDLLNIKEGLLNCGLYLQGGLYSNVCFQNLYSEKKRMTKIFLKVYSVHRKYNLEIT